MNFGDLKPLLDEFAAKLRKIDKHLTCMSCASGNGEGVQITTGGSGDIPAGLRSVSLVKTNSTGTIVITFSDATSITLTDKGEFFSDAAADGNVLPDYGVSSSNGGTWIWHGIK